MARHVRQRLLGHPVKRRPAVVGQLLHPCKNFEVNMNAGALGKGFYKGMQRRYEAQIIQHRRPQFPGKPVDDVHGFGHQPLGARNVLFQPLGIDRRRFGQRGQPHINPGQGLGYDIMQLPADFLALLFLHRQYLTRQLPQLLLQMV